MLIKPDLAMKGLYRLVFSVCILFISSVSFGQTAGDFRSLASGNWNAAGSWETFDGTSWVAASAAPTSADGVITIRNTHTIVVDANVSVDQTIIAVGGQVTVNSAITFTVNDGSGTDLSINGVLVNNGSVTLQAGGAPPPKSATAVVVGVLRNAGTIDNASASRLSFSSGSQYDHTYTTTSGAIPLATWDVNSTCLVSGYTSNSVPPGNLNQNFGHFTWNTPSSTAYINLNGGLTTVNGNLTFNACPSYVYLTETTAYTLNVGGNFNITGNSLTGFTTDANVTVNVTGNFSYSSSAAGTSYGSSGLGTVSLNSTGSFGITSGSYDFTFNAVAQNYKIGASMNLNGSTITNSGPGAINFTFNGTAPQVVTSTQVFSFPVSYSVLNNAILDIPGDNFITSTHASSSLTVDAGGTIRAGSTHASGAIQTGTTAGNVRITGTRSYGSGSAIVYNGLAGQFTGNGHPTTSNIHTVVNNAAGVTLASNLNVTGNLTLTSGNLSIGSHTLTLEGNFTPNANFLNVTSASNLTINGTGAFGSLAITGSTTINNFTINRTSTGTVTLGTALATGGTFTQTDGDVILNGNTLTLNGIYSRTAGNITVDGASSLVIGGTGTLAAISFSGTALNTLTLDRASSTVSTGASLTITNLNLTSGTFNNTGTITMASGGTITRTAQGAMNTAPGAATSYNVVYNIANDISTGVELPTGTTQLNNLTKGGSALLTLSGAITVNGTLTFGNGTFNSSTHALDIKGNLVSNSTSQLTSSTVTFSGTTTLSGGAAPTFGNVTITGSLTPSVNYGINGNLANSGTLAAGSVTVTFGGTTGITGTGTSSFNHVVINASSTLTAPTASMNVAGNITNNGTFNHNGGTVVFNGTTSISGTVNFANITVSNTLNAPATLNVAGHFANNGTFNRGTGTVVFNGSATQNIQGSAVTDFNNINVANTAGPPAVQVQSNANLRGTLTLAENSRFDADGSGNSSVFTLISAADNPTSDAAIAALPAGAAVEGSVTVQRFMAIEGTNGRMYRYISSPVQTPALSQIQTEIPVTGTFTGASACSGCGTSASMWTYNETVTGDLNLGYEAFAVTANTETLATGRGYSIYVRGNIEPVLSAGSARWDVRAPINSGTVTFPATFTSSGTAANDGWNLVGNPYPSTIDWDAAAGWTKTNVNNAIYMRDNGAGKVASYVGGTGANGGSRYIPMGQGFFVQATASPTFSATEAVKTAGQQTIFFREHPVEDVLRIALKQGSVGDEAVIRFTETATEGFDGAWDAHKLKNEIFNLSSITTDNLKLAINGLPNLTCGTSAKLDISDVAEGSYMIEFSQFESFSNDVDISFYDVFTDTRLNVREKNSYSFDVTADPASFGGERFSVSFSYKTPVEALLDIPAEVCKDQQAVVNIQNSESYVSYSLYRDGIAVTEEIAGNGGALQIPLDPSLLSSGDNHFVLRYSPSDCKSMVSSKQVDIRSLDLPVLTTTDGSHCGTGSVSLTAAGGDEGSYRWYETETGETLIAGVGSAVYNTPALNKSKTYYVSAVNTLGCEGGRRPVNAVIEQYEGVIISANAEQDILISSYDAGNQWYFNGQPIAGATAKQLEVHETGLFEVEVKINGCVTRAGREMIVLGLEQEPGKDIRFFPNPVKDKFSIEVTDKHVATHASVYGSLGQPLGNIKLRSSGKKLIGEYSFQPHPAGVYFIKVFQGARSFNYKVIKK